MIRCDKSNEARKVCKARHMCIYIHIYIYVYYVSISIYTSREKDIYIYIYNTYIPFYAARDTWLVSASVYLIQGAIG